MYYAGVYEKGSGGVAATGKSRPSSAPSQRVARHRPKAYVKELVPPSNVQGRPRTTAIMNVKIDEAVAGVDTKALVDRLYTQGAGGSAPLEERVSRFIAEHGVDPSELAHRAAVLDPVAKFKPKINTRLPNYLVEARQERELKDKRARERAASGDTEGIVEEPLPSPTPQRKRKAPLGYDQQRGGLRSGYVTNLREKMHRTTGVGATRLEKQRAAANGGGQQSNTRAVMLARVAEFESQRKGQDDEAEKQRQSRSKGLVKVSVCDLCQLEFQTELPTIISHNAVLSVRRRFQEQQRERAGIPAARRRGRQQFEPPSVLYRVAHVCRMCSQFFGVYLGERFDGGPADPLSPGDRGYAASGAATSTTANGRQKSIMGQGGGAQQVIEIDLDGSSSDGSSVYSYSEDEEGRDDRVRSHRSGSEMSRQSSRRSVSDRSHSSDHRSNSPYHSSVGSSRSGSSYSRSSSRSSLSGRSEKQKKKKEAPKHAKPHASRQAKHRPAATATKSKDKASGGGPKPLVNLGAPSTRKPAQIAVRQTKHTTRRGSMTAKEREDPAAAIRTKSKTTNEEYYKITDAVLGPALSGEELDLALEKRLAERKAAEERLKAQEQRKKRKLTEEEHRQRRKDFLAERARARQRQEEQAHRQALYDMGLLSQKEQDALLLLPSDEGTNRDSSGTAAVSNSSKPKAIRYAKTRTLIILPQVVPSTEGETAPASPFPALPKYLSALYSGNGSSEEVCDRLASYFRGPVDLLTGTKATKKNILKWISSTHDSNYSDDDEDEKQPAEEEVHTWCNVLWVGYATSGPGRGKATNPFAFKDVCLWCAPAEGTEEDDDEEEENGEEEDTTAAGEGERKGSLSKGGAPEGLGLKTELLPLLRHGLLLLDVGGPTPFNLSSTTTTVMMENRGSSPSSSSRAVCTLSPLGLAPFGSLLNTLVDAMASGAVDYPALLGEDRGKPDADGNDDDEDKPLWAKGRSSHSTGTGQQRNTFLSTRFVHQEGNATGAPCRWPPPVPVEGGSGDGSGGRLRRRRSSIGGPSTATIKLLQRQLSLTHAKAFDPSVPALDDALTLIHAWKQEQQQEGEGNRSDSKKRFPPSPSFGVLFSPSQHCNLAPVAEYIAQIAGAIERKIEEESSKNSNISYGGRILRLCVDRESALLESTLCGLLFSFHLTILPNDDGETDADDERTTVESLFSPPGQNATGRRPFVLSLGGPHGKVLPCFGSWIGTVRYRHLDPSRDLPGSLLSSFATVSTCALLDCAGGYATSSHALSVLQQHSPQATVESQNEDGFLLDVVASPS